MQNKLQELTDKLYNEGLSKGKQEGEEILAEAKAQSEKIISNARAEAEKIIADAHRQAEEIQKKTASDVKMAASQSIAATKKDIENLLITKIAGDEVKAKLASADFIKEILQTICSKFDNNGPQDLAVILPESLQKDLEPYIKKELAKALGKNIEASFSKKIAGGFQIGPKDGGYFISFTDATFTELISEYLRPATKKILFG